MSRRALAISARDRLVHGLEGEPRMRVPRKQRDAVRDPAACVPSAVDEPAGRTLTRRASNCWDNGVLGRNPRRVCSRQAFERASELVRSRSGKISQSFHAEGHGGNLLVRFDAFNLCRRKAIGAGLADNAVRVTLPACGGVYADRVLAHVTVVQIGDGFVDVLRVEAPHVRTRMQALFAANPEAHLEA